MKKTLDFIFIIWLLLSTLLISKNYMSLALPTGIDIQISSSIDQNKTMDTILRKCDKYGIDIYKFEYLGIKSKKNFYKVYYTNTSSNNLLSFITIVNGNFEKGIVSTNYSDDKPYVKSFNLDFDYEFYNLKDSLMNTTLEGVYKVISTDEHKTNEFINELKRDDVHVDVLGKGTSVQTNENVELIVFFIMITLLLLFYIIVQNQKDISIKKLNGYTNVNIMLENNLYLIKKFVMWVCVVSILNIAILLSIKEYDSFGEFLFKYYLLQFICLIILLLLNNIANIYLLKNKPASGIKSFSKDIVMDISSMMIKTGTLTMIIMYLLSLLSTLIDFGKIFSNVEHWENTKNYAFTITQGYYPSTIEEEVKFESKFKYLYAKLNDDKSAILLDSTSFLSNVPRKNDASWSYDNSKIIVNRNYLKESNIPSPVIKQTNSYGIENTVILIPSIFIADEEKIKNNFMDNMPLNHKDKNRVKTIIYEVDISIFTANLEVSTKNHIVLNPIIIVDDNNFEGYYYLSTFSNGGIHIPIKDNTAPYKEIQDSLIKAKLDNTIKITPLVYSRFSEKINEIKESVAKISLQVFVLLIVAATLVYNSIIIFITKNSKEIAVKKLMGYRWGEIYSSYYKDMIFIWMITSACVYLYLKNLTFISILGVFIVFELLITYLIILIQGRKNILSMLKGSG